MARDRKGRFAKRRKGMGMNALIYPMLGMIAWNVALGVSAHVEPTPVVVEQKVEEVKRQVIIETKIDWTPERIEKEFVTVFEAVPAMKQVAICESSFRHFNSDGTVLQGRVDKDDTGILQINKRYHQAAATQMGLNLDNPSDNMKYGLHLYKTQGFQPWSASKKCHGLL